MFMTGHLSTSYLLCRFSGLNLRVALLAAVFPDLVDKPLQVIGLSTTGRHIAHNLFALALSAILLTLWRSWGAGLS